MAKDKILPGLARAMERTNYYLVSSKSNGKDKILPGLARAMDKILRTIERKKHTWSSKSNGKDKILPGLARAMERKGQNIT